MIWIILGAVVGWLLLIAALVAFFRGCYHDSDSGEAGRP